MLIIFIYIKHHIKLWIIYYTSLLEDQVKVDLNINWSEIYPDTLEDMPPDMSVPNYNYVGITDFLMHIMHMILKLGGLLLEY